MYGQAENVFRGEVHNLRFCKIGTRTA